MLPELGTSASPPASSPGSSNPESEVEGGEVQRSGGLLRITVSTFIQNRLAVVGFGVIFAMALICFVGPFVYHTNQVSLNPLQANQAPSGAHPLGTDSNGFDILGRLMVGGQSALEIGLAVALVATLVGTLYGAIAAVAGGVIDAAMMRVVDGLFSIPALFLLLILADMFTPNLGLMIVVLAFISWLGPARLVRGESLSLRTREFVQAARVAGGTRLRIVVRHIMPNAIGTIMVNASFQVADAILILATLSYLGLGLPPPATNWGSMLANGITYLYDGYWWEVYPAGLSIVVIVVAFNLVGDALRDSFDVRLQRR